MVAAGCYLYWSAPGVAFGAGGYGFTLIYYLNGFVNFAYGESITYGAYFALLFNVTFGLGFYASIIPAALLAGALSVATYLLLFRPAIKKGVGPSELIILSVGLSFMLRYGLVLTTGAQNAFLEEPPIDYYSVLGVGATNLQLLALVLVIVMAFNLYWLIYRTGFGEVVRALADNEELARVSGINPHKVSVRVWFIAGCAGGLAGVFTGVFALVNPLMGWNLILITVMVSIVAGVGSVRGAVIASIVAGILTAFVTLISKPLYAEILLLLGFILILWTRRRRDSLMAYLVFSLSLLLVYLALALLLHVQFGLLGIPNFGVVGFWGLGMYVVGVLQVQYGASFIDAMVLLTVIMVASSYILGRLLLRCDPQAILCGTLAFSAVVSLLVVTEKWLTFGVVGLGTIAYPIRVGGMTEYLYFFILLGFVVALQYAVLKLHASRTGRLLIAIRDNEELAASLGKDTFKTRLTFFTITCTFMGLVGGFTAPLNQFLTPNMLVPGITFAVWISLALGGKEHALGSTIGVFVTFGLFDILIETYAPVSPQFAVAVPNLKLFLYGALLVFVLVYRPTGILTEANMPTHRVIDRMESLGRGSKSGAIKGFTSARSVVVRAWDEIGRRTKGWRS